MAPKDAGQDNNKNKRGDNNKGMQNTRDNAARDNKKQGKNDMQ